MTSSPTGNSMDAITSLLAERQRYESWIATLETRRESTPAHVYDRVRGDYEKRLTAVMEQLAGRSGDLEATVSALAARVAELMNEETVKRDERAEAELRAAVGEFSPEQWNEMSGKSDAEISRIAAQRTEIGGELAQVQDLLVQATRKSDALTPRSAAAIGAEEQGPPSAERGAPRPAAAPAPTAPAASAPPSRPAPVMTTPPELAAFAASERPPAAPLAPPTTAAAAGAPAGAFPAASSSAAPSRPERGPQDSMLPDFDELAFLKSVVEPRDAGRQGGAAGASDRPVQPAAPAVPADVAPSASSRPAAPPPVPSAPAPSASAPRTPPGSAPSVSQRGGFMSASDLEARGLVGGASGGAGAPRSAAAPAPSPRETSEPRSEGPRMSNSVPAFLKDVPAEQVKTLKCQECGTMNYPTEWYCERCGGELAAM